MFTIFSQQDPRWASIKLGKSPCTIGRYGCTTTVLAMGGNYLLNKYRDPHDAENLLSYTADGLILWGSLPNMGLRLVSRIRTRNDAAIQQAYKDPDKFVILEVNHNHWLWLIGRKLPYLGYRVVDPWDAKKKYTNAYGNNITGCAIISKT